MSKWERSGRCVVGTGPAITHPPTDLGGCDDEVGVDQAGGDGRVRGAINRDSVDEASSMCG